MALSGRLRCALHMGRSVETSSKWIGLPAASSEGEVARRPLVRDFASASGQRPQAASKAASAIDFSDHQAAFRTHTLTDLVRAWAILNVCSLNFVAKNSERIISALKASFGKRATAALFTPLHRHFAGGESFKDLAVTLNKLEQAGVGAILDYAAEADIAEGPAPSTNHTDEAVAQTPLLVEHPFFPDQTLDSKSTPAEHELDANVAIFLESVHAAGSRSDGFAAIKVTGLIQPEDLITMARLCPRGQEPSLAGLPAAQLARIHRGMARLDRIADASHAGGVRLMVDAEQTYFQPAIDWLVRLLQCKYNTHWPAIFNTYQCYLTDSHARLAADLKFCSSSGIKFGAKLVRGAYMVQERERAKELGQPDPIFSDIAGTHANYDRCVAEVLPHVLHGANVMIASHNEHSVINTIAAMDQLKIAAKGGVYFGQLLGMADHVTFPLGAAGYAVYKYVPYGPVYEVVAYLSRRVQENSSVTGGEPIVKARAMLKRELKRRMVVLRKSFWGGFREGVLGAVAVSFGFYLITGHLPFFG